jgi:hypothetical protein
LNCQAACHKRLRKRYAPPSAFASSNGIATTTGLSLLTPFPKTTACKGGRFGMRPCLSRDGVAPSLPYRRTGSNYSEKDPESQHDTKCEEGDLNPARTPENHGVLDPLSPATILDEGRRVANEHAARFRGHAEGARGKPGQQARALGGSARGAVPPRVADRVYLRRSGRRAAIAFSRGARRPAVGG